MSIIINRYDLIPTAEDLPREFDEAVANALKSAPADSLDGDALGTLPETDSDVVGADFMRDLLESGGGLGERAEDDADSDFDLNDFDVALGEMIERLNSRAAKENLVMVRSDIFEDAGYIGVVCGVSRPETGKYYILGSDAHGRFPVVGFIFSPDTYRLAARANAKLEGFDFYGAHIDGDWQFTAADGALLQYAKFDTTSRLFSRNYGLLESGYMLQKRAVLVGCGSVGSHVALELARSGVGKFVLTDTDT
ncbi:MAG: ThiF family adenylyltransferase, partial [Oscillospiraceae bacterium]|nr:ThiF family adenylyltransferase [Oscillospiraceae bacterium]